MKEGRKIAGDKGVGRRAKSIRFKGLLVRGGGGGGCPMVLGIILQPQSFSLSDAEVTFGCKASAGVLIRFNPRAVCPGLLSFSHTVQCSAEGQWGGELLESPLPLPPSTGTLTLMGVLAAE